MKVLVTGGAGYIGSHTVGMLLDEGFEVVVFDNLSTGHRQAVPPAAEFVHGDLRNPWQVAEVFANHAIDGIFHFASYILVGESMQKPWMYLRDNVMAAANLLDAAVQHGVGRFILSSTANLFDDPESMPITEQERIVPGSPYGESKAMIERYLYWMDRIHGLKYCSLRYFNACGAHPGGNIGEDHPVETHLIPLVLRVAMGQRDQITIFGNDYDTPDGTAIRDYIHVIDVASAHIGAFKALEDGPSRLYNLGSGQGYSVQQVIETARKVTGHPIPAKVGERRPGDAAILVADNTALVRDLGWTREYPDLELIIQTAWNWHTSHPNGYSA